MNQVVLASLGIAGSIEALMTLIGDQARHSRDFEHVAIERGRHDDAALFGEFERIGEKVEKDLPDDLGVQHGLIDARRNGDLDRQPGFIRAQVDKIRTEPDKPLD